MKNKCLCKSCKRICKIRNLDSYTTISNCTAYVKDIDKIEMILTQTKLIGD